MEKSLGTIDGKVFAIRRARQGDLARILWGNEHLRASRQAFLDRQARGEAVILLPTLDDEAVGHLAIDLVKLQAEGGVYLYWFHVLEPFARRGIGTAVIKRAEQIAIQAGRIFSEIAVGKDNEAARRLYERLGYQLIGDREDRWIAHQPDGSQVEIIDDNWVLQKSLAG